MFCRRVVYRHSVCFTNAWVRILRARRRELAHKGREQKSSRSEIPVTHQKETRKGVSHKAVLYPCEIRTALLFALRVSTSLKMTRRGAMLSQPCRAVPWCRRHERYKLYKAAGASHRPTIKEVRQGTPTIKQVYLPQIKRSTDVFVGTPFHTPCPARYSVLHLLDVLSGGNEPSPVGEGGPR